MAERLHITRALLQTAWQQHQRGPGWPATFDETSAHPLYSRLLRCQAVRIAQAQQRALQRLQCPPHAFDPRRAAANDKD